MQTSFRASFLRLTTSPTIDTRERKVDQALADSFPASDPPPWTLGRVITPVCSPADTARADDDRWSSHTTVVVAASNRTAWQWLASGIGAIAVTMLLPISIFVIGLPIVFVVRGILEALGWLATRIVR